MEKGKYHTIAVFWIYFLKVNGLIGEKHGYPSATTYLMMLVNYLQQQAQLPNLQDRNAYMKYVVKGSHAPENNFIIDERLTTKERERIGGYLNPTNLALLNEGETIKKYEKIDTFQLNLGKEPQLKTKILADL